MSITYLEILKSNPAWSSRSFSVDGLSYEGLVFYDGLPAPSEEELENWREFAEAKHHNEVMAEFRRLNYIEDCDPIFMKYQRGEVDKQEWLDAVESIRLRYPYVPVPNPPS